jgi:hypothetical protein
MQQKWVHDTTRGLGNVENLYTGDRIEMSMDLKSKVHFVNGLPKSVQ